MTRTGRPKGLWREYGSAGEGPSAPLTLVRSGGFPKVSSAPSWTERNSARRTRASSRETSVGRPSAPSSGPSSDSEQPVRPGSGKARLVAHVSEAWPPEGTSWVPPSQRGHGHPFLSRTAGFPPGPGDAALPAHRQHLPTRPVSSVHSSAGGWSGRRRPRWQPALWGESSGTSEGSVSSLGGPLPPRPRPRELRSPLPTAQQRRGPPHGPRSPASAPRERALRGPAKPALRKGGAGRAAPALLTWAGSPGSPAAAAPPSLRKRL